jgi:hypothetical protein
MTERTIPNVYGIADSFMEASCYASWHEEAIEELSTRKEPAKSPIENEWLDLNYTI